MSKISSNGSEVNRTSLESLSPDSDGEFVEPAPSELEALTTSEKAWLPSIRERKAELFDVASFMLIAAINFANFVNGIYMAVPGPTLLFLAERVSCGVGQVSTVLAGRSAGNLLGAFAATAISKKSTKYWDATMRLGVSLIIYGTSTIAIPLVTNLWALIAALSIGGFLFGFTNTGFLALQLDIWGEKRSRPLMQLYQVLFSIGATLAPVIASPFLEMAAKAHYKEFSTLSCSRGNASGDENNNTMETMPQHASSDEIDPVTWVYAIIGALYFIAAITLILMSLNGVEDRARSGHNVVSEAREEEPLCRIAGLLLCVIAFYAFQAAAVNVFASYIYSVAYCSKLQLTISKASSLNFLYWGVFIIGRLVAFFVSSKARPSTVISACTLTLVTSTVVMSTLGERSEWLTWAATSLWAFAMSPLFGSGKVMNTSARALVSWTGSAWPWQRHGPWFWSTAFHFRTVTVNYACRCQVFLVFQTSFLFEVITVLQRIENQHTFLRPDAFPNDNLLAAPKVWYLLSWRQEKSPRQCDVEPPLSVDIPSTLAHVA